MLKTIAFLTYLYLSNKKYFIFLFSMIIQKLKQTLSLYLYQQTDSYRSYLNLIFVELSRPQGCPTLCCHLPLLTLSALGEAAFLLVMDNFFSHICEIYKDLNNFILKSRDITLPAKVHLVKAMVFPVVMYGCKSWTIKKAECQRIDACELWYQRRLLRVPWTAKRSNQSILEVISPECSLEGLMLKLKLQYFGHLM